MAKQALLWILAGALAGCAVKAKPAPPAGFIAAQQLSPDKQLPFHKAWWNPEANWASYTKI